MPDTLDNLTTARKGVNEVELSSVPKRFGPSIIKLKTKDDKIVDTLMQELFLGTIHLREKMLEYREWYMGLDQSWQDAFNADEDGALEVPGLTSMMAFHLTELATATEFNEFWSPQGDHIRAIPKNELARESTSKVGRLMSNYITENPDAADEMYRILRGKNRDGVAFSKQFWDLRTTVDRIPNIRTPKFNPVTKEFEEVPATVNRTRMIADRPTFEYLDPLLCGMPIGTKRLNKDGRIFIYRDFMYREQLVFWEKMGYIGPKSNGKSFIRSTKDMVGEMHNNGMEAPEVQFYFRDLFNTELNTKLGFKHPKHKFIVDNIFFAANERDRVRHIISINNIIYRDAEWEGTNEIPVVQHDLIPLDTTWFSMGIPEIIQDYFREDNVLTRLRVIAARKEGHTAIFMPRELIKQFDQHEINKLTQEGKIVPVDPRERDVALSQQIVPVTLAAGSSQAISDTINDMREQARQYTQTSIVAAGGKVPSALRSTGSIQAASAESSGPERMRMQRAGQGLSRVITQMAWLVYFLEPGPKEVPADAVGNAFHQVTRQDINNIPDMFFRVAGQIKPFRDAEAQTMLQLAQLAQSVSGPVNPQSATNFGTIMDVLWEKLTSPEDFQRIQASKGSSPNVPQLTNNSVGLPPAQQ